jgi:HK97 family phage portal protein
MTNQRALEVLYETIPMVGKDVTAAGQVTPIDAWLADLYGYYPFGENRPLPLDEAVQISAVLICLDVPAQDISKTPRYLRRKLKGGGSEIVEPGEHWLARMLALEPNPWHTWSEFIEMLVLHLGAVRNAFVAKRMTRGGKVEQLIPVLPGRVRIFVDEAQQQYLYDVERLTPNERMMLVKFQETLLHDELIHFRGRMFDGLFGFSNLDAGAKVMGFSKALMDYQTRLYKNDGSVRGVFQMPKEQTEPLPDPVFKRLKEQLSTRWHASRDAGVPIVLEQGMEFKSVAMNADQAEVAKNRDKAVEDVARIFRIPPHKMMHIVNVKYENMETLEKSYVQDTLIPICKIIEERMTRSLLTPEERLELFIEFDRDAMQLTDVEKQAKMIEVMMDRGAMTIDQALMRRGMNPLPNGAGNVRLIPQGYHLVDDKNQIIIQAGQPTKDESSEDKSEEPDDDAEKGVVTFPELRAVK